MVCMLLSSTEHVDELQPLVLFPALQQAGCKGVYLCAAINSHHMYYNMATNHAP